MRRALPILGFLAASAATLVAQSSRPGTRATRPPNVVLIVADDLGYGELGCYGQSKIATPHCDRLAREGMRFTDGYSGAPVCAPSRCVLLTGKHMGHAHVRDNREIKPEGQEALPRGTTTLATLLKGAGYTTACIGKWGLGAPESSGVPAHQGFDRFFGFLCQRKAHDHYPQELWRNDARIQLGRKDYAQDLFVAEARAFVREERERPFFLLLTPTLPHLALQVPEAALAGYRGTWAETPYDGKKGYTKHETPLAAYAAMIGEFDRGVGEVLRALQENAIDEETLVIVTSDNGPTHDVGGVDTTFFASAGPLRGRKGSCYEGGIRVPWLARWPGKVAAGRVSHHPIAAYDVLPTLCELAGVDLPGEVDGLSFAPTLLGAGTQRPRDALYFEFPGYGGWQAVRMGSWIAVRSGLHKDPDAAFELYDLATDLSQRHDAAMAHPDLVARAKGIATRSHVPSALFPFAALDR